MSCVVFDLWTCQPSGSSKFHGGGETGKTIFQKFVNSYGDLHISAVMDTTKYMQQSILDLCKSKQVEIYDVKSIDDVYRILSKEKPHVFFSSLPYYYTKKRMEDSINFIGVFHGLRGLECLELPRKYHTDYDNFFHKCIFVLTSVFKRKYKRKQYFFYKNCLDSLDRFACDSEHTKYAIISNYGEQYGKDIKVLYPPIRCALQAKSDDESLNKYGKYILLIGGNRWEKNTIRSLLAINELRKQRLIDHNVVVVGELPKSINKLVNNDGCVVNLGYVESDELEDLYKNCSIFVYTTMNEGFGAPPVEAMKYGKTVVVSCVCSLQEVCGDAAYYVNPLIISEIKNRILRALCDPIDIKKVISQYQKVVSRIDRSTESYCKMIYKGVNNI